MNANAGFAIDVARCLHVTHVRQFLSEGIGFRVVCLLTCLLVDLFFPPRSSPNVKVKISFGEGAHVFFFVCIYVSLFHLLVVVVVVVVVEHLHFD